jgi:PilZ domain.
MPEDIKDSGEERRRFMRLNVSCEVGYKVLSPKPPKAGLTKTRNISAGGICLIAEEKLNPGAVLELNFNLPEQKPAIKATGKVVWVKPFKIASEQEHFDCGVEFSVINQQDQNKINQCVFALNNAR